jgi:hypothetical protein
MTGISSWARGAVTLLAIAAALAGWSVVHLQDQRLDGLERELADARRQAAARPSEPAAGLEAGTGAGGVEPAVPPVSDETLAMLQQLKSELAASEAEREVLNQLISQAGTELKELHTELDRRAQTPSEPGRQFRTLTRTRMRAGPTIEAAEVAVIAEGARLQVIDTVADGAWHEVRLLGYAFHDLLEPLDQD